jgi:hypothetical protein
MVILSLPSIACGLIVLNDGINYMNNNPVIQFGPGPNQKPDRPTITIIFLQFALGILFTRLGWISKAQLKLLEAAWSRSGSRPSSNTVVSESDKRSAKTGSKADLKERAQRLSMTPGKATRALADNLQVEMLKNADRPSTSCGSTSSGGVEPVSTPPLCSREIEHGRDSAPFSVVVVMDAEDQRLHQRDSAIVPESEVSRSTNEGGSFPPSIAEVSRSTYDGTSFPPEIPS